MEGFAQEYANQKAAAQRVARDVAYAETAYQSNGSGIPVGRMPGEETTARLADIIARVGDVRDKLTDIAESLTKHLDRILGPQLLSGKAAGDNARAEPPHEFGQLTERVGNLEVAATRIRRQIDRLAKL